MNSLFVTASCFNGATATFTGSDKSGTVLGQVTATVNIAAPVQVDLSSLGFIAELKWEGSGGTPAGCCGGDQLYVDNIASK